MPSKRKNQLHIDTGVTVEAEYAEPFATLLDPNIFSDFERYTRNTQAGRPEKAVQLDFSALLKKSKTKTSTFFGGAGLSKDYLLRMKGLEPPRR